MHRLLLFINILLTISSFSQQDTSREALIHLKNYEIPTSEEFIKKIKNQTEKKLLRWNLNSLKNNKVDSLNFSLSNNASTLSKVLFRLYQGDIILNTRTTIDSTSLLRYKEALHISIQKKDSLLVCFTLKKILHLLSKNRKAPKLLDKYIRIYNNYAYDYTEKVTAKFHAISHESMAKQKEEIKLHKELIPLIQKGDNRFIEAKVNLLIGAQYSFFFKQNDSALSYYRKAYKILKPLPYAYAQNEMFAINTNIGILYANEHQHEKAIIYYKKALKNKLPKNNLLKYSKSTTLIYESYHKLKELDSAFHYINLRQKIIDSFNEYSQAIALNDIETKYETEKKEQENQSLKQQQQYLWTGTIFTLATSFLISFLVYKNTKRKQRIAEQEQQIEKNKVEKILKEQELATIDAMLLGQEKERQRLANDLHDNLGSTLATVKLHFEHLKRNRANPEITGNESFYIKTNELLDEAYQKVRTIAHEKNSGVMAQQGLLPALKNLAKKISHTNQLQIEVQDFGIEQRLENTLEISLFRIIQELITNIIKHAQATEVSISLTNHDAMLNLMIEDNGIGFDATILPQKEGMGLNSIEKRIEHLEGTFEIDSSIGKGTNIIIDIPL